MKEFVKEKNLVGVMRFDFADGEKALANRWSPYQKLSKEDIAEIQPYVNGVMFKRFNSFSKIIERCNGTGRNNETVFCEDEGGKFGYAIKLIPVRGEYNGYIYAYRKDVA